MAAQPFQAALLIGGLMGFQIPGEDGLRVDDDLAPPGKLDDHIGSQTPVVDGHRLLLNKIAMRDHAGQLGHPLERNFPPAPAHGRRPQRIDQISGFLLQTLLRFRERFQVLVQPPVRRLA